VFSSDCFGAPLPSAELAAADDARAVRPDDLRTAQLLWATVDSPWVHSVDPGRYEASLAALRALAPSAVISSHLPPMVDGLDRALDTLRQAPAAAPFTGPDQQALDRMLAGLAPAAAS
jgi:hypothetical protein